MSYQRLPNACSIKDVALTFRYRYRREAACFGCTVSKPERTLSEIEFFAGLSADELEALAPLCRWRLYEAGQQIIGHLDYTSDIFFIVSGRVRVIVYSASGKEVMFRDLGAGKTFGELAAIDGNVRSASVVALTGCVLATMTAEGFHRVLQDHPDVARRIMAYLVGLVRRLSDRVVEFSVLAVRNRIHAELLRLARERDLSGNEAFIAPAPTHAEIASRVSTHREAVTREFNALSRDGLIERRDGGLVIHDVARLAHLVEKVLQE
jgi:CRP/FNR family cyclic AMP-dependent transcriptional regulator